MNDILHSNITKHFMNEDSNLTSYAQCFSYFRLLLFLVTCNILMPNTHHRRRRDSTVELSCVGGVYWALDYDDHHQHFVMSRHVTCINEP